MSPDNTDANVIYDTYKAGFSTTGADVFYAAPMQKAWGVTYNKPFRCLSLDPSFPGDFVLMDPTVSANWRVLAHEVGHVVDDVGDYIDEPWIFYPDINLTRDDTQIMGGRRLGITIADDLLSPTRPLGVMSPYTP
jgi:hypothetical protein